MLACLESVLPSAHALAHSASWCASLLHSAAPSLQVRREDVLSVWSGIRPLAKDPSATNTADAVRDHLVISDDHGMVTVTGGKWTTYRCGPVATAASRVLSAPLRLRPLLQGKATVLVGDGHAEGPQKWVVGVTGHVHACSSTHSECSLAPRAGGRDVQACTHACAGDRPRVMHAG
jgi:glycerol-3-phosphate dehydrogenase